MFLLVFVRRRMLPACLVCHNIETRPPLQKSFVVQNYRFGVLAAIAFGPSRRMTRLTAGFWR